MFPSDNWWNEDISSAPLDPNSAAYIAFIGEKPLHPDFGKSPYGLPYIVVGGDQPKRQVAFRYAAESDPIGYPIPDEAITEPGWIEQGTPGQERAKGDRHMLIVDKDRNHLYELYNVFWDGTQWLAASGAFFDMNTDDRRPEGWTSADAAGLAILPGLLRYDEMYGSDEIRHAFRVSLRRSNNYVWPASHGTGPDAAALPLGSRLRLKASVDLAPFPPEFQRVFRAMQRHGLIAADNGADMFITGTMDSRWDNLVLNPTFAKIHASDFELIQLGWRSR